MQANRLRRPERCPILARQFRKQPIADGRHPLGPREVGVKHLLGGLLIDGGIDAEQGCRHLAPIHSGRHGVKQADLGGEIGAIVVGQHRTLGRHLKRHRRALQDDIGWAAWGCTISSQSPFTYYSG